MTDRLPELVRQRALVLEQLAWLEKEIALARAARPGPPVQAPVGLPFIAAGDVTLPPAPAIAAGGTVYPSSETPVMLPLPVPAKASEPIAAPDSAIDDTLERYRVSPAAVHQDVRKGCFLYFALAFVVLGIVVAILYFTISSR